MSDRASQAQPNDPVEQPALVDAHHHLRDLTRQPQPWLDEPTLEPLRRCSPGQVADICDRYATSCIASPIPAGCSALTSSAACVVTARGLGYDLLVRADQFPQAIRAAQRHPDLPRRLRFGSDWPVCELAGGWERWARAAEELLAECFGDEIQAVLSETAAAFYRIRSLPPSDAGPRGKDPQTR